MFDRELDYYGIASTEGVTDKKSIVKIFDSFSMEFMHASMVFSQAQTKHGMFHLAHECHYQVIQTKFKHSIGKGAGVRIAERHKLFTGKLYVKQELSEEESQLFVTYLEMYFGLMVVGDRIEGNPSGDGYLFDVTVKECHSMQMSEWKESSIISKWDVVKEVLWYRKWFAKIDAVK